MRLPTIQGIIRRRILVNYRVRPDVMRSLLPAPFRPKLHKGFAIAGICLIRLEQIRPKFMPLPFGITSENAAHRVAVLWEDAHGTTREGVYIPRRDTGSWLNHLAGGRLFPGEHNRARFHVKGDDKAVDFSMHSADRTVEVRFTGKITRELPASSCFSSVAEASAFFEGGSIGYSATRDGKRLDGVVLETKKWCVEPLELDSVHSSFFASAKFPKGAAEFDSALIMQNIPHEWHSAADMKTELSPCDCLPGNPSAFAQS
jgi:hypothetical protein